VKPAEIREAWRARWPEALACWSRYTRLTEPRWCLTPKDAKREGLRESFAAIRLKDHVIILDLHLVAELRIEDFGVELMAHEIGHHVYCPGNLLDDGRAIARMRRALPTLEQHVPRVLNLYQDILINDRLQRVAALDMAGLAAALQQPSDRIWTLYMRIYEILWSLSRKTLTAGPVDDRTEGDAQLGARLVRVYARDWVAGSGRFAALLLPYLVDGASGIPKVWLDALDAGDGADVPLGLAEIEADEAEGCAHPSMDPLLSDLHDAPGQTGTTPSTGQHREPFEYGQILKSLGIDLSDHEIAVRYYRERARPHLVRFPTRIRPETEEPLAEGLEPWDAGHPIEDLDPLQSVLASPRVIPGVTTVRRTMGTMDGRLPRRDPVDLDLYVDCSGSMPNPQQSVSYLALAGAIVALSALRAGARVQVTLWSGAGQYEKTDGFVRDERVVLRILTGYLCGGTAFPLHVLRDTKYTRPTHLLVISDEGVDTMLAKDERGAVGEEIARDALARAGGGGSLVLNLYQDVAQLAAGPTLRALGWTLYRVTRWEDLVAFARDFSRARYAMDRSSSQARDAR